MNEHDFETEKYLFLFRTIEKFEVGEVGIEKEDVGSVSLGVQYLDKFAEQQITVEEIKEILNDMGKWETIVQAAKSLLEDLGITKKPETKNEEAFGYEKYKMKYCKEGKTVYVVIGLTQEESLRRSKGNSKLLKPSEKEIAEQIRNIAKWQKLKRAVSEVKTLIDENSMQG